MNDFNFSCLATGFSLLSTEMQKLFTPLLQFPRKSYTDLQYNKILTTLTIEKFTPKKRKNQPEPPPVIDVVRAQDIFDRAQQLREEFSDFSKEYTEAYKKYQSELKEIREKLLTSWNPLLTGRERMSKLI